MIPTGWFTVGIIIAIIIVLSLMRHVDKRDYRDQQSLKSKETRREILERVTAELISLRRAVRSRENQIERLLKEINEDEDEK